METFRRGHPLLGVLLKVISTVAFAMMATQIKFLSDRYPTGEVAFFRSAFALIPVLAWVGWRGMIPAVFITPRLGGHLLRSIAGATSMFFGFSALARLPLSDATAIGYAAPLMTVVLAALLLREPVRIYRWAAVVIGFVGVLVMLADYVGLEGGPERSATGAIFALLGAFFGALAATQTRRLTWYEAPGTIVVYFSIFTALFMLVLTLPFGWVMPQWSDAPLLVGCGICGGIGQVLLTQSYRYGEASLVAPFEYVSMLWAIAIGYVLFANLPTLTMLIGAAIVISSGLFVIYREQRLGMKRAREQAVQPPGSDL